MFHRTVEVPEKYVGLVIGKKGRTIKSLELKHNVNIFFRHGKFNIFSENSSDDILDTMESISEIYSGKIKQTDECPICLESIDTKKNYVSTKCGHCFHFDCLMRSLDSSSSCPICRSHITEKKKVDVEKIIADTVLVMRRSNYWFYLYSQAGDIFNYQVIFEQFMKEPLRYALSKVR